MSVRVAVAGAGGGGGREGARGLVAEGGTPAVAALHHAGKVDAPSGTAVKTAEMIRQTRAGNRLQRPAEEIKVAGARGGDMDGIRIHSVRLPGYVAHQEVIFGGQGQTLTIRHDSTDRTSFMPGVLMAVKKVRSHRGLVYGLENLLD